VIAFRRWLERRRPERSSVFPRPCALAITSGMPESTGSPNPVKIARQISIRCTYAEETAITAASQAIDLPLSQLVEFAIIQACVDMGMLLGDDTRPRLRPDYVWPFAPARPDGESAQTRVAAYLSPHVKPTAEAAAWAVGQSLPNFAIGATLRYVALLRRLNHRRRRTPRYNEALASLELPYGVDELVRR
jgi:hypothetical protein